MAKKNVPNTIHPYPVAPQPSIPQATAAPRAELVKVQQQVMEVATSIQQEVAELTVTTPEEYAYADALLGRIRNSLKLWTPVWERMQDKVIRPIRAGLEELYSIDRDVRRPHEKLEETVKGKMKLFKIEEARQLRAAEELQQRELHRIEEEAAEKQRAIESAKTPQMKGRLQAQQQRIMEQAVQIQEQAPLPVTQGVASTTRTKKQPSATNLYHFAAGIANGDIPTDCLIVNQSKLNDYYKQDPEAVSGWPGITIVDDITIVGR